MKSILTGASALALLTIPTMAHAQDSGSFYDGPYIGVSIGLAAHDNRKGDGLQFDPQQNGTFFPALDTSTGANAFSPGFCNGEARSNNPGTGCIADRLRPEYAVKLGYDKMLTSNIVAGILVEGSLSEARDATSAFSTTPASYYIERRQRGAVSARGRLGFTPDGNGLFYVTGGVSYGKIKHDFTTTNTANTFTEFNDDKWKIGGEVGGGAEVRVGGGLTLGLEYLFHRYRDNRYFVRVGQGTAPITNPFVRLSGATNLRSNDSRFDYSTFRLAMNYRF